MIKDNKRKYLNDIVLKKTEVSFHINRILRIVETYTNRQERLERFDMLNYNVIKNGYMKYASKIGTVEFYPRKNIIKISVSRQKKHFSRQFDIITLNVEKGFIPTRNFVADGIEIIARYLNDKTVEIIDYSDNEINYGKIDGNIFDKDLHTKIAEKFNSGF